MTGGSDSRVIVIPAETEDEVRRARDLVVEYAASLGFELDFQSFEEELAVFPGDYAPPRGSLLLAVREGEAVGCVAARAIGADVCEMKRLYVQPNFRGGGIGEMLVDAVIDEARRMGYKSMRLDAIRTMEAAVALYRSKGFKEIPPYRFNPVEGALYMELSLA